MKKMILPLMCLVLVFSSFSGSETASINNTSIATAEKKSALFNLCTCSTTFIMDGMSFDLMVAFSTNDGGCSYCNAYDSYGGIWYGYVMVAEGIPSESTMSLACGYNCG